MYFGSKNWHAVKGKYTLRFHNDIIRQGKIAFFAIQDHGKF